MFIVAGAMESMVGELLERATETADVAGAENVTVPVRVMPTMGAAFDTDTVMTGSGIAVTWTQPEV